MVRTGWVGPLIGLAVCLVLYFLLLPVITGPLAQVLMILLIIGAVICGILLVVGLVRNL